MSVLEKKIDENLKKEKALRDNTNKLLSYWAKQSNLKPEGNYNDCPYCTKRFSQWRSMFRHIMICEEGFNLINDKNESERNYMYNLGLKDGYRRAYGEINDEE